MRCAACGATNPLEARWCGQCYASFEVAQPGHGSAAAPTAHDAQPAEQAVRAGAATASAGAVDIDAAASGQADGQTAANPGSAAPGDGGPGAVGATGFRRRGDVVEWECVTCGSFNLLDDSACGVCGTPLSARFSQPAPTAEAPSWGAAMALSAVLPGTGHALAGHGGTGVARGLLYTVWLAGGLLLLLTAGASAAPAAVPLLLGALLVWAGTLLDLVSLRTGSRQLLTGRTLLWLVVAVTVLLLLGAFSGAASLP